MSELDDFKAKIREIINRASDDDRWDGGNYDEQISSREEIIDAIETLVTDWEPVDPDTFVGVTFRVSDTETETFETIIEALLIGTSRHVSKQVKYSDGIVPPIKSVVVTFTGPVEDIQEITARYAGYVKKTAPEIEAPYEIATSYK